MTERNLNPDELVSSYLDGETTPAETDLVENDSALMARVKELGRARDAVSAPVPGLAEAHRARMIDAALTAADEARARGVVLTLRRFSQSPLAVAAAVALIAAVLGAALLTSWPGSDDTMDVATGALTPQALDESGAAAEEAAPGAFDSVAEVSEAAPADHDAAAPDASFAEAATDDAMADQARADEARPDEAIPSDAMAEGELAMDGAAEAEMELDEAAPAAAEPTLTELGQETPAVALGPVASLDALVQLVAESSRTQGSFDGPEAESGSCAGAVRDHARDLGVTSEAAFVAALDGTAPASVDGLLVRSDDGALSILYAVEPDCTPSRRSLVEAGDK